MIDNTSSGLVATRCTTWRCHSASASQPSSLPLPPRSSSTPQSAPPNTRRNITDPRALAIVLEQAEAKLAKDAHPDPYRREYRHSCSLDRQLTLHSTSLPRRHKVVRTGLLQWP